MGCKLVQKLPLYSTNMCHELTQVCYLRPNLAHDRAGILATNLKPTTTLFQFQIAGVGLEVVLQTSAPAVVLQTKPWGTPSQPHSELHPSPM